MKMIDVYYDYRSPYAYFITDEIAVLAGRTGAEVCWHPVSIHILLNLQAGKAPWAAYVDPLPPVKRRYLLTDVARGAEFRKIPMKMPVSLDSVNALKATLRLQGSEGEQRFRENIWQAIWTEGKDISDLGVLQACASHLGPSADAIMRSSQDRLYDTMLEEKSIAAFAKGIFGVPAMCVDGEVFFGSDRLDVLEWRLKIS